MSEEKLFGMPAEKGRWMFVVLGFIINICLGSVYAYSVFRGPVQKLLNMSATEAGLPFMVFLALFATMVFFGGLLLAKLGPKMLGWLGGVIVGVGWILASFSTSGTMLTITYGLIGGGGVGLAYGAPLAVAGRWFPDKRGLALGLTLAGFGGSPFVSANVAAALIKAVGPMQTFLYMGIAFLVIILVCFIPYRFPKDGWLPEGWKPPAASASSAVDLNMGEMAKTSTFLGLFLCYIIGSLAGLMAIGISASVAQEIIKIDPVTAATLVGVFAIFNGVGRPIFGVLTDKLSPKMAAHHLLCHHPGLLAGHAGRGPRKRDALHDLLHRLLALPRRLAGHRPDGDDDLLRREKLRQELRPRLLCLRHRRHPGRHHRGTGEGHLRLLQRRLLPHGGTCGHRHRDRLRHDEAGQEGVALHSLEFA